MLIAEGKGRDKNKKCEILHKSIKRRYELVMKIILEVL